MSGARTLVLQHHPDTPSAAVRRLTAQVWRDDARTLLCQFQLSGDVTQVRLPGTHAGRRADGLWEHTCFEAFVGAVGSAAYVEFNFSPSLDWAAYRFDSYRLGMRTAALQQSPGLNVRRTPELLTLSARVHLEGLADLQRAQVLHVGLAAVVEDVAGDFSYWALRHAPGKADFHHPHAFTHDLTFP